MKHIFGFLAFVIAFFLIISWLFHFGHSAIAL